MEVSLLTSGSQRALETVKVLHETVLALRTALETSKREIVELRGGKCLKRDDADGIVVIGGMEGKDNRDENKPDSGAESDDIDDIELVFTTGETDPSTIHEDLVPILEERTLPGTAVVETDISKCGVLDEGEANLMTRRNTLPNPLPYRPILHREILAASRMAPARSPCKALLPQGTQDTGAQTDITALPWKSETHLAHKMSCNLTTLPSKFALPVPQTRRLPLSDKTREARRVLLSDINFTSMVPELSRSADHLEKNGKAGQAFGYRTEKQCEYLRQDSGSRCCASSVSIPHFVCEEPRRRHSWRPPAAPCCHALHPWSSVPSSPVACLREEESFCLLQSRKKRTRVHFQRCDRCGQSLPNLRGEADSGESTDSLVEEAEEYLRRSIDSMIVSRTTLRRRERSNSDTDSISSFEPPNASQPFLPKSIKELKSECFVKVIAPGGRIAVGKVRYAGQVPGKAEPHVGVELPSDTGFSDGCFSGQRFFDCDSNHAVFVPFRKVVIAWNV